MASRLDAIEESNWKELARTGRYRVSSLARGAKMSRQKLHAYFLSRFGMPPKKWLDQLKLRDALPLLRNGELVKQVHERLGFGHPSHLARAFRRLVGRNPGACRALNAHHFQRGLQKGPKLYEKVQKFTKRSAQILAAEKRQRV